MHELLDLRRKFPPVSEPVCQRVLDFIKASVSEIRHVNKQAPLENGTEPSAVEDGDKHNSQSHGSDTGNYAGDITQTPSYAPQMTSNI